MRIILKEMNRKKGCKGYLIDGFPANIEEAKEAITN
jgi:hypothetical protein